MNPEPLYHRSGFFKDFWESGTGRYMIDWTGAKISPAKFEKFSHLYYKTDDTGDAAARELFFSGISFADAIRLAERCAAGAIKNDHKPGEKLRTLFRQMEEVPKWVDKKKLDKASDFSRKAGLSALIVLRDFTLMGGYDYAYLNKPLIFTGALKKGAVKRLKDTLDFWINVTRKDAMQIHNAGFKFCATTRLIHSYLRLMILGNCKDWDRKKWGLPINSWDMIATYIGFSLTFLLGLKKLGMPVSKENEDCLFHLWKYIGYLIGIPHDFMPDNARETTEQFYLWSTIQPCADEDSILLAKALLDENLISPVYDEMGKRKRLRYLHICCIRHLLDRQVNERLKIPHVNFRRWFPALLILRNKLVYRFSDDNKLIEKGDKAQQNVLKLYLEKA